jgi:uncharacterized pyridoxamine 5'-phosphate oxidase family protein
MNFEECIRFANDHPICSIATVDGDQPRVRMFGLWFADNDGFYFSAPKAGDTYRQLTVNPKVELCFYVPPDTLSGQEGSMDMGTVMRASGTGEFLDDESLKQRLLAERPFLQSLTEHVIFRVQKGEAWFWTFADSMSGAAIERVRF